MTVTRVERHRLKRASPYYTLVDDLCWKAKNMYNYGNYIVRREFIQTAKEKEQGLRESANWIRYYDLRQMCRDSEPYKALGSNVGQTVLRKLDATWKGFFNSIKDYGKNPNKYLGRPKIPKYLNPQSGRYECGLDNNKFKIKDGYIYFCWKPLKDMNEVFATKIPDTVKLIQLRFVPKNSEYIMEIIYEVEVPECVNYSTNIASIDLGIDNLMTVTTNCGMAPFVVCGYNAGWKQESNLGRQTNQKFVGIPYLSIVERLAYKCENEGIRFITTEESYTSGTSFLDGELPVKENYDKSRRVHRGLFKANNGKIINADVNGSYQIMKKVFPNTFSNGIVGVGLHPSVANVLL